MKKTIKIGFCFVLVVSLFTVFSTDAKMLVINNQGIHKEKIVPLRNGCRKVINNCNYPIGVPLSPSGATKSFFQNPPSCVVVTECKREVACAGELPENAIRNTKSTFIQDFNGYNRVPGTKTANYNPEASSNDCRYTYAPGFHTEDEGKTFISNFKTVSCQTSGGVQNSHYIVKDVIIERNGSWPDAPNCDWECDNNFRDEGGQCVDTCALPRGGAIHHNESTTAYNKSSATCPDICSVLTRTCDGKTGKLSGSDSYRYKTCSNYGTNRPCGIANGVGQETCPAGSISWGACTLVSCNTNYTPSGNTCILSVKHNQPCTGLPAYAVWNNVSSITQNLVGNNWIPSLIGVYNTISSNTECRYKAADGYHTENNGQTFISNTRSVKCTEQGGPVHSTYVSSYVTQNWINNAWSPNPATKCDWTCDAGYHQEGNSCVSNTRQEQCTRAGGVANSSYIVQNVTVTWNNGWPVAQNCDWKCNAGYRNNSTNTACINTCTVPESLGGGTKTHGQSVTAWNSSKAPDMFSCPDGCESEQRVCNGETGLLGGSYQNISCSRATQSCTYYGSHNHAGMQGQQTCQFNGQWSICLPIDYMPGL